MDESENSTYKQLWTSVLIQAVDDLSEGEHNLTIGKPLLSKHELIRNDARVWLNSKNNGFNSFLGICDTLGICPIKTRATINNKKGVN